MTGATSVVTPERFSQGMSSFNEWMQAISIRQQEFQQHYDEFEPDPDDLAAIRRLVDEHGVKALILGEDWCPDVWRGLPVLAKIGERTGMEVRMFFRDQNKDIMAEFLNGGEFESIPTIVFYDRNHRYLGHWIERARVATREIREITDRVAPGGFPPREDPRREEVMTRYRQATLEAAGPWRHAQVREIRELLEQALA